MENTDILKIENLKMHFPIRRSMMEVITKKEKKYVRAVDGLSYTLKKGEILGFIGESGCGKSNMSRTILRLTDATDGIIDFDGTNILDIKSSKMREYRAKMNMIFQDPFGSLNPRRSVKETLQQTIHIHNLVETKEEETALILKTLEEVGLVPAEEFIDKYPALLSGGQLQRVSIARVLILQPKFVIADEPVSMLDVSVRIGVLDLIFAMKEKYGISFIYITHDLITARYICDRIAIMYLGKIVEIGATEEVLKHPKHPYTKALLAAVPVPDPTAVVPELPIKGYVPIDPDDARNGCNFLPRCVCNTDTCVNSRPVLTDMGEEHSVSCFNV